MHIAWPLIAAIMNETYYEAMEAYNKVFNSGHTEELQEVACKNSYWAYRYAKDVRGADINYCQKLACKEASWAYCFAKGVKGADIDYCQKMACKDPYRAYCFARDVVGADLGVCLEAVRGSEWEDKVSKLVIERVIG